MFYFRKIIVRYKNIDCNIDILRLKGSEGPVESERGLKEEFKENDACLNKNNS